MDDLNSFGAYLKNRRERLDPSIFGFSGRRRTPGLRREEVAQRANISTTWYTWLEQGRGGAPSLRVLESLSKALMLTKAEREYLFLISVGRPPKQTSDLANDISPRLQRFIDALQFIPAIVATCEWDIIAWNKAATLVLTNYPELHPNDRNILRRMFLDTNIKKLHDDWENTARYLVATFRAETARNSESFRARELINELSEKSYTFRTMWNDNEIQSIGEGVKQICHITKGKISLEFSSFVVEGRSDLKLLTYNPLNESDIEKVHHICTSSTHSMTNIK